MQGFISSGFIEKRTAAARDFGMVRVKMMRRRNGKSLSENGVTAVGGTASEGTSGMRKPTFADQMHFVMFFVQESLINFLSKGVRSEKIAFQIHAVNLISTLSEQTLRKYVCITISFVRRPAWYRTFCRLSESKKNGEQLQLAHM